MNQNSLMKAGVLGVFMLALVWVWMPRATYPKVTSPESDKILRLLGTACGSRSPERLQNVKDVIAKTQLPPEELQAFEQIIALADDGRWEQAQQASRDMATDQVN